MKARFLALAALVLGLASCQTEPEGLNVQVGDEVDATITVAVADVETRAGSNSAKGVFDNGVLDGDATMRYVMRIYDEDGKPTEKRYVDFSDEKSVTFPVRLAPKRAYTFVVWADVVLSNEDVDNHYNTDNLENITIINTEEHPWKAMDESRDAFTGTKTIYNFNNASVIKLTLRRPNAKLRVLTKDMSNATAPHTATFTYDSPIHTAYNAVKGEVVQGDNAPKTQKVHNITYSDVYNERGSEYTLFSDYFFADDKVDETITFTLEVMDSSNASIANISLNSGCKVKSTWLTTIAGNLLTSGSSSNQSAEF